MDKTAKISAKAGKVLEKRGPNQKMNAGKKYAKLQYNRHLLDRPPGMGCHKKYQKKVKLR